MNDDRQIMERVRASIDDCTRAVDTSPSLLAPILHKAKGEPPVKKKMSAALALAFALVLIAASALAVTALQPDVLDWLFRGEEAPAEMQSLVQQTNNTQKTKKAALTLTQTLFDGEKLTVGFRLENPTGGALIYTVGQAQLNGEPLAWETAQMPYGNTTGLALGGDVDGTPLAYENTFFVTFNGTSKASQPEGKNAAPSIHKSPLQPMEDAVLSIRVNVYQPLAAYTPVTEMERISGKYDVVTDLLPITLDDALLNMNALPHPSRLKMVETTEFSFPIVLKETRITTVAAAPGEYKNDLYTLQLDHFSLNASGGKIECSISSPVPAFLTELSFLSVFPEDVFEQALAAKDHSPALRMASSSSGCSTEEESEQITHFHFDADFRSYAGELPRGVYLIWLDDTETHWDTALYIPLLPQ